MKKFKRVLVFQHLGVEHPGTFRDFLREDGVEWCTIDLNDGEAIPELDDYDALWVMGGPMDVWDVETHPWLEHEKAAIREAVIERELPFLGFCLGHQLLADALGGVVKLAAVPEIGVLDIDFTAAGRASPFLRALSSPMKCLQWHSAEVATPPSHARVLAASTDCAVQAIAIGKHALSMQFHIEITAKTISEWGAIPAYKAALAQSAGPAALAALDAEVQTHIASMKRSARLLYQNWKHMAVN